MLNKHFLKKIFHKDLVKLEVISFVSLGFFILSWAIYSQYAQNRSQKRASLNNVTKKMIQYWMRESMQHENRVADINVVNNLTRSVAFFASTAVLIIAGVLAALSTPGKIGQIAQAVFIPDQTHTNLYSLGLVLWLLIFVYAFFKYSWALFQFHYASILIGAGVNKKDYKNMDSYRHIINISDIFSLAFNSFNKGIRAYYFGIALLSWFIHPGLLVICTIGVVAVVYRREFRSRTLKTLLRTLTQFQNDE